MGIRPPAGPDPAAVLDPDLALAARGIAGAVAVRLGELVPALRASGDDGSEPHLLIDEVSMDPADPLDPFTLIACLQAHDAYVAARGRPGAASPGAIALARLLTWAARAEMLGRAPLVVWIGPASRRPDTADGHTVTATVRLTGADGPVRAVAVAVVT